MSAIVAYRCPVHGESPHCSTNNVGERVCSECDRVVDIVQEGER